jgi:hypothetical protein
MRRVREEQGRVALQRRLEMQRAGVEARRLEQQARMERHLAEREHQRQVNLAKHRLKVEAARAEGERVAMQRRIAQMQNQVVHHHQHSRGNDCLIM